LSFPNQRLRARRAARRGLGGHGAELAKFQYRQYSLDGRRRILCEAVRFARRASVRKNLPANGDIMAMPG
jgi:hypothetical protein